LPDNDQPLSNDLLIGVAAIADYTGLPKRDVYYALSQGRLPAFKLSSDPNQKNQKWLARKSELRARLSASYATDK
jgi:hypothetical protein